MLLSNNLVFYLIKFEHFYEFSYRLGIRDFLSTADYNR